MEKLVLAIGLVLAFEGALYALFPTFLRNMVQRMSDVSERDLRLGGLLALALGCMLVALVE